MTRLKLGEIAHEYKGKATESEMGVLPIVGLEHLSSGDIDLVGFSEGGESTFTKKFLPGHVLFGRRRAYQRKASLAEFPGICSGDITVIEADEGALEPRLLPFIIQNDSLFDFAVENSAGSLSPRVKWARLAEYELDLPTLERQHELADIFWAAQDVRRKYKQLLRASDDIVKSRFVEMFGDPISSTKWPKARIKDVCDVRIGPFGSMLHKDDCVVGGHPLINPSHILNGELMPDPEFTVDDETYERLAAYKLLYGDVVLGRRGEMGRCAVVYRDDCLCGTGSMIVRAGRKCRSDYIQKVISHPSFVEMLEHNAVGVTLKNLNAKTVGEAQFCLPPMALQDEYASFVSQVDKSKVALQQSLDELNATMAAILNEELGTRDV